MKIRNKIFLLIVLVQTAALLLLAGFSGYGMYMGNKNINEKYLSKVNSKIQNHLNNYILVNGIDSFNNQMPFKIDSNLIVVREDVIENISIFNFNNDLVVNKKFKIMNYNISDNYFKRFTHYLLGKTYKIYIYDFIVRDKVLGQIFIKISNKKMINNFGLFLNYIFNAWLALLVSLRLVFILVDRTIVKNVKYLTRILDDLSKNNIINKKELKYTESKDEIASLARAIDVMSKDMLNQTYINKQLNVQKSIMLANITNNLLTPLNGIVGASDLLKESKNDKKDLQKINFIEKSTNILLNQLTNILTYMDLKENINDAKIAPCIVNYLFQTCVQKARGKLYEDSYVKINYIHDDVKNEYVKIDAHKLKQAIDNLMDNAIESTKEGEINFTVVEKDLHDKIKYTITLEDSGRGIKKDKLKEIDKFIKHEEEYIHTKKFGLGLSIASLAMRKLHGNIDISSVEGVGTKVCLEFTADKVSL